MNYIVGSNMPGFMPDSEPYLVENLADAKKVLAENATHYLEDLDLEDLDLDPRFTQDQVIEFSRTLEQFDAAKPQTCNVYLGDYVFWITEE